MDRMMIFDRRAEYVPLMEVLPWLREALQQAAIVQARLKSGELTRDEADRLVDAIVEGVE